MPETNIEANFAVPSLDVQTGTYGSIELKATLMTVPAELIIYNDELRQYVENIKLEVSQSVENISQSLEVDVKGRLGYKFTVNTQTGLAYTLQLPDEGTMIRMTSSEENQVVVPLEATVPFEVGTIINVRQSGAGTTTIAPETGVTVNTPDASMKVDSTNLGIGLVKVGPNEWDLVKSFVGVPLAEIESFVTDLEHAMTAMEEAQASLDTKMTDMQNRLTASIEDALGKAEKAISDITDATTLADFGSVKRESGYQKLPGGLILQWGKITSPIRHTSNDPTTIVKFPIVFPTACIQVQGTHNTPSTYSQNAIYESEFGVHSFDNTQVRFEHYVTGDRGGHQVSLVIYWFAIGH